MSRPVGSTWIEYERTLNGHPRWQWTLRIMVAEDRHVTYAGGAFTRWGARRAALRQVERFAEDLRNAQDKPDVEEGPHIEPDGAVYPPGMFWGPKVVLSQKTATELQEDDDDD